MAATILNSPRAVEMSVYVVRAFVQSAYRSVPRSSQVRTGRTSSGLATLERA